MSLKSFHILFVVLADSVLLFFSYWAWGFYQQNQQITYMAMSVGALFISMSLGLYGYQVYKKFKAFQ